MDSQKHQAFTGVENRLILGNIYKTVEMEKPLIIRIPIIAGHNNTRQNITETAHFITDKLDNKVLQVQLPAYRPLGLEKYASLNRPYPIEKVDVDIKTQKKSWMTLQR